MAAPLFLRGAPLLRLRLHRRTSSVGFLTSLLRPLKGTNLSSPQDDNVTGESEKKNTTTVCSAKEGTTKRLSSIFEGPEYRQWKDREAEILKDIEPITLLTKDILHSDRYLDGERLSKEDEQAVVENLLAYHPHSEDKIGCGLDSIMVDRHPQFKQSRCLFVVRTDGGWIDFSYHKCIRAYIRDKYPSYAERFIRAHFKRGSG